MIEETVVEKETEQQAAYIPQALPGDTGLTQAQFEKILGKEGLLTQEEEEAVFRYYQAHNTKENRNLIALKNDKLVWKCASQYASSGVPLEDLHSEGFIGMMTAVERYEFGHGTKFGTYATFWVEEEILRFLKYRARMVRIPANMATTYAKIIRFQKTYCADTGVWPSAKEIAEGIGEEERNVKRIMKAGAMTVTSSLNAPVTAPDGSEDSEVQDYIKDTALSPEEEAEINIGRQDMVSYVQKILSEREWYVIKKRFGFEDRIHTLEELGQEMGVTRERIRQIEGRALRKMKSPTAKRFFMAYR